MSGSFYVAAIVQPRNHKADEPGYGGTFMPLELRRQFANEIASGQRRLPMCVDHADLTGPRDVVPDEKRIGYWREAWVDRHGHLWMLGEMDGARSADARRIYEDMKRGRATWGVSLYHRYIVDARTKRVLTMDSTHAGVTKTPDLADMGPGSWIWQAADNPAAMRRALRERHFQHPDAHVPAETRARWMSTAEDESKAPVWSWPLDAPLASVTRSTLTGTGSKPRLPLGDQRVSAASAQGKTVVPPTSRLANLHSSIRASCRHLIMASSDATLPVPTPTTPSATAPVKSIEDLLTDAGGILGSTMTPSRRADRARSFLKDMPKHYTISPFHDSMPMVLEKKAALEKLVAEADTDQEQATKMMLDKGLIEPVHVDALKALSRGEDESVRLVNEIMTAATSFGAQTQREMEKRLEKEQQLVKEMEAGEEEKKSLKRKLAEHEAEHTVMKRRYEELQATTTAKAAGESLAAAAAKVALAATSPSSSALTTEQASLASSNTGPRIKSKEFLDAVRQQVRATAHSGTEFLKAPPSDEHAKRV